MTLTQGKTLYSFIHKHKLRRCLELGFYHGVSSAYIAGALEDAGGGCLVTIDRINVKNLQPNIGTVLERLKLTRYVRYFYENTSYSWRLKSFLEQGLQSTFDFCYIDGGHTWDCTGFAFFLVSRLLKPGGWILFDDLHWTFEQSPLASRPWVRRMPLDERQTPQVGRVFELLVKTDPAFDTFTIDGSWGFARKAPA